MAIDFHEGDLPSGLRLGPSIAIDTETMGLNPIRDRLCVVQLCGADGHVHIVRFLRGRYDAPNLKALLADPGTLKIFHFARFDLAALRHYLGVMTAPVYCTKMASRLVRTFTDKHGLKDLVRDVLGVDLSKEQQTSDWGAPDLTAAQLKYAASDVIHLHAVKARLDEMLQRENRRELAEGVFRCLPVRAELDLLGWAEQDFFAH
ncbi:MAG: ribonuclease D [Alphaproteobacteria bacterium]|nr:ribonuclease D [Alphaproteobacteria bacterium]